MNAANSDSQWHIISKKLSTFYLFRIYGHICIYSHRTDTFKEKEKYIISADKQIKKISE